MPCGEDYFLSEREKNEKVSGKFLYAVTDFSIFKKDEAYWLEYIGNDTYVGRSDNILNQKVEIAPRHLVWYFSEKPRSAFEKELADWFYGMRTWGLDVGDVGCEAFCDSQAHKAAKRLLMYAPTLNDDDMTQEEKKLPDGLEKAAEEYNKQVIEETKCHHNALTYAEGYEDALLLIPEAFIAGAEWDRAKMMEGAVEGKVIKSYNPVINAGGPSLHGIEIIYPDKDKPYLIAGDKVRIIVIKEDEK